MPTTWGFEDLFLAKRSATDWALSCNARTTGADIKMATFRHQWQTPADPAS
jgi:hypothetical protein